MSDQSTAFNLNATDYIEEFITEPDNTKHIVVLVPGTTDPININTGGKSDATGNYWQDPDIKKGNPFGDAVEEFVKKYPRITVYHNTFSWTGDNQLEARVTAAKKLNSSIMVLAHRAIQEGTPVSIHLLGHSHGGNVINEYSRLLLEDSYRPTNMTIRSIVYLSTPFFRNQAQIETKVLHPKCKVINVYNKYDLTQNFVANFSMHQMPALISTFENDLKFKAALKKLKKVPYVKMAAAAILLSDKKKGVAALNLGTIITTTLAASVQNYLSDVSGKILWVDILTVFKNLREVLILIQGNFDNLNRNYPDFITGAILNDIAGILTSLQNNLLDVITKLESRLSKDEDFTLETLSQDIADGIGGFVKNFNDFISFLPVDADNPNGLQSNFSDVITTILLNQIQTFDDTTWDPESQFKGLYKIKHIDITTVDEYDKTDESKNYDAFLAHIEKLEDDYVCSDQKSARGSSIRRDLVFTLLAQEEFGMMALIDEILRWMGILTNESINDLVTETRDNITAYADKFKKRNFKILYHKPVDIYDIPSFIKYEKLIEGAQRKIVESVRPYFSTPFSGAMGGIPYLAVESHSVSRRKFLKELQNEWIKAMPIKGLNTYYVKRKKQV